MKIKDLDSLNSFRKTLNNGNLKVALPEFVNLIKDVLFSDPS